MADKLMYVRNDNTLNIWNQPINIKSTQSIRKRYYKTLGIIVINSPLSLPSWLCEYYDK